MHIRTVCKLGAFKWKEWSEAQGHVFAGLKGENEVAYPSLWLAVTMGVSKWQRMGGKGGSHIIFRKTIEVSFMIVRGICKEKNLSFAMFLK